MAKFVRLPIFLGHCSDSGVLCEQICVPVPDDAYECSCYGGYSLLQDSISCVGKNLCDIKEKTIDYSKFISNIIFIFNLLFGQYHTNL